jgi:hypothetical protein
MRRETWSFPIWCSVVLLVLSGIFSATHAQVLYGSLTGNVTDPSQAGIPNAKVEAANLGTGISHQAVTDARGTYLFNDLQPGTYKVTATANGFQTTTVANVVVNGNEVRRLDLTAQIATATQSVEVSAAGAALQTDKSDVHAEITSQEVTELPYSGGEGKNFQSLLYLVPGAGIPSAREANSEAGNPMRAQALMMNGVSGTSNSTRLDGTNDSYPWLPINIAYVPSTEAIDTVNITTNDFDAEQGAAGGAAVNVTIKSGTNDFHGVAFERNQNNDETAVNYFNHSSPLGKNIFNQFGFAFGGPVWIPRVFNGRNKLFFFLDYQDTIRKQYASDVNLTLPTPAMRQGDFNGTGITIYDPLTGNPDGTGRTPFPNNMVPANRIDPASAKMTSLLPALTRPGVYTNNYDAFGDTQYQRSSWDYKVNYTPTDKAIFWGRYSFSPISIPGIFALGPAEGDAFGGGQPGVAGGRIQTTAAGFTYTVSPTLLVDGNVGYTRQNIGATGDDNLGPYGLNTLQIPGTNGPGTNYNGIPGFQITGVANMGNTNTGSPFLFRDNQYTTAINLGKVQGSHNLRFGFEYDHYGLNHFQPQGGTFGTARGTFGFFGDLTELSGITPNANGVPANSWAQFLLGYPSRLGKITQFSNPNALRFSNWALYARDQWQVTRKLTINYGLRWEYYPIFSHDNFGAVRYDLATNNILIGCEASTPCDTGASTSYKDFAPRFGLAYRLGSKTVLRGGYGITIDPDNFRNQRNAFPSVINQDYNQPKSYQFDTTPGVAQASLRTGIPAPTYPDISQGILTPCLPGCTPGPTNFLPSTGTTTFPKYVNRGYIQSWNFFVQHEFSPTLTAEAGYVGTHGVHQDMNVNLNGSLPGTGTAGRVLYPYLTTDLNSVEPFGDVTYNALQTRLTKHIGPSVIGVAYTFSKTLDNYSGAFGGVGDSADGSLFRAYPVSYSLDKSLASFDRTHILQAYYVYQLPFGRGHHYLSSGIASKIFGGFQIGGTLSRFSGLPFTIGSSTPVNAYGQTQTASQIASVQILGGHDANSPYFTGASFTNPAPNTLGTTGRDLLRGPGFFNMDENVSRTFGFKENRIRFEIVGEAFNLTNTPSFATPGSFGTTTFANPVLNPDGSVKSYGNYSVITNTVSNARQLQVSGYLRF